VKAILQQPGQAKAYFRQQLPERLLATIDLEGLQQISESFLDDKLQESFSDLLYKVPLKNHPNSWYLSLLLEHKSYADPYVTIQLGHYIFSALLRQIRNGEKPMPVIPVLLYHGKEAMPYKTHRRLYADLSEESLEYIPDFAYIFHDLQSTSEETITSEHIATLRTMFLLLKYAHDERKLLLLTRTILRFAGEDGNYFKTYFVYFLSLIKEKTKIMESILELPDLLQRKARNAYEAFIQEGMEKGMKEGIEKGMKEGMDKGRVEGREEGVRLALIQSVKGLFLNGISIAFISKSLGLSEAEVEEILREEDLIK
jgi:predicted transposase/invertase (TIGR01784 family)